MVLDSPSSCILQRDVTVIITTSPARSDPDIDLVRATVLSLELAGLAQCRTILVCDHFEAASAGSKCSEHGGVLSADRVRSYRARLDALRHAEFTSSRHMNMEFLELQSWHGFALATFAALKLVNTPLVCVVQHDLCFLRPVNLLPVAQLLFSSQQRREQHLPVNCVALPKRGAGRYRETLRSRTGLEVGTPLAWEALSQPSMTAFDAQDTRALRLTRLPQFLDGTHLASVQWYRTIFKRPLLHGRLISVGQFTEDVLGQYMLQRAIEQTIVKPGAPASEGVLQVCAEFGTWLWSDGEEPPIYHLDSRVFLSDEERERRGIPAKDTRYRVAAQTTAAGALARKRIAAQAFLRFLRSFLDE